MLFDSLRRELENKPTGSVPAEAYATSSIQGCWNFDLPATSFPQSAERLYPNPHLPSGELLQEYDFGSLAATSQSKQWPRAVVRPPLHLETFSSSASGVIKPFDSDSWNAMMLGVLEKDAPAVTTSLPTAAPEASPFQIPSIPSLSYLASRRSPALSSTGNTSSSASISSSSGASSPTIPNSTVVESISRFKHTPSSALSLYLPPPIPKICSHCHATRTPLWRRSPFSNLPLCNACGLYLQQRGKMRPAALIAIDAADDSGGGDAEGVGIEGEDTPQCCHCQSRHTSVWRRGPGGKKLCNACGVYKRLRGRDRPLELRKNKVRPRAKHPKKVPMHVS
ncbi:gata zinc finger domain-containing protein [Favolaschia claudopus]|uniref:Gata zinc finger domain-containing protein n=1 Tax=Favolaschia claudopus TaxID=2862362 RepID=A0AAW0DHL5_9AGAR